MAKKRLNSGTTKGQRIAIWGILLFTIISTIALYFSMFLSQENQLADQKRQQENIEKYQKVYQEYQDKVNKQGDELSKKYFAEFSQYASRPAAFNSVDEAKEGVKTEDLKVGDGTEINDNTTSYTAYYLGWKPDGTVFDGSIDGEKLKNPLFVEKQNGAWGMIEGWTEGIKGMKIGGARQITIPADKAYGEAGSPNQTDPSKTIKPGETLKFVVMIVPNAEKIEAPDYTQFGLGA